ncbi:MAG: biopolymer transporter ExbD [Candidatus Manganitrophus sp.]|nr:biopolymer transporter ExbD [Candidatus Manganitrophus sp.]
MMVSLDGEGRLFLMEEAVDLNGLKANLAREAELNPGVRVTLAADGRIHYQQVVGVLDAIKQSGVTRVSLASEQGAER